MTAMTGPHPGNGNRGDGTWNEDLWRDLPIRPALLERDYREIVRELNADAHISICLLLDMSATPMGRQYLGEEEGEYMTRPYLDVLKHVGTALDRIEETLCGGSATGKGILKLTYFASRRALPELAAAFRGDRPDFYREFPAYRSADLIQMLAFHYSPTNDTSFLDRSLVRLNDRTALSTETVLISHRLGRRTLAMSGAPPEPD
jgi:hypothetical protein